MIVASFLGQEILKHPVRIDNANFKLLAGSRYLVGGYGVTLESDMVVNAAASMDVGNLTASTLYYVYLVVSGGVASVKLSLSADAPVGYLAYKKIGYVFIDSSSYIVSWTGLFPYTPTFSNLGSVSALSMKWGVSGPNLEVVGTWTNGTVGSGQAYFTLPPGLIANPPGGIAVVGDYGSQGSVGSGLPLFILNSIVYFGTSNWQVGATGTQLTTSGFMSVRLSVPVVGWPSYNQWLTNV